jgi:hypothetical protein
MKNILMVLSMVFITVTAVAQSANDPVNQLHKSLAKGWNTWDTNSQISFTHMPEGVTINLALKEYKNALIMRNPLLYKAEQHITLGAHSDDGSYTDLELEWEKMKFRIQSATDGDNLVILVSCQYTIVGYSRFSLILASVLVNCQFIVAFLLFR